MPYEAVAAVTVQQQVQSEVGGLGSSSTEPCGVAGLWAGAAGAGVGLWWATGGRAIGSAAGAEALLVGAAPLLAEGLWAGRAQS